jgi:hypothetical protein
LGPHTPPCANAVQRCGNQCMGVDETSMSSHVTCAAVWWWAWAAIQPADAGRKCRANAMQIVTPLYSKQHSHFQVANLTWNHWSRAALSRAWKAHWLVAIVAVKAAVRCLAAASSRSLMPASRPGRRAAPSLSWLRAAWCSCGHQQTHNEGDMSVCGPERMSQASSTLKAPTWWVEGQGWGSAAV